jgi:hypothetical protein
VLKLISWKKRRLCLRRVILGFLLPTIWTFFAMAQTPGRHVEVTTIARPNATELKRLSSRPLRLPTLRTGQPCPVSKGSRETVPHVGYIFCSTCLFFGDGPTYFALLFLTNPAGDVAAINLDNVSYREGGVYSMKTPWVTKPEYSGPVLTRGQRLDGEGKLEAPQFEAPSRRLHESDWSFWPDGITVTGPGCYGIQIDTDRGTDIVVFKATGGDASNRSGTKE